MSHYQRAVEQLLIGQDLPTELAEAVMGELMDGELEAVQIAALLTSLTAKGETADELLGLARAMRARAVSCAAPDGAIDTCGTGGSGQPKPNVSTLSALVLASCGVPVAKHGNRSNHGRCGSTDVLEALGVPFDVGPLAAEALLRELGLAFLFAPRFHPAMRHAAPVRRAIGFRTTFNFLGPLANPARVRRQLLGVSDPDRAPRLARALLGLGIDRALVFCTHGGLDELAPDLPARGWWVSGGQIERVSLSPGKLGLASGEVAAPRDVAESTAMFHAVLGGDASAALTDLVALNAGAALWVAEAAEDLLDGVRKARAELASRRPRELLAAYARRAQELTSP